MSPLLVVLSSMLLLLPTGLGAQTSSHAAGQDAFPDNVAQSCATDPTVNMLHNCSCATENALHAWEEAREERLADLRRRIAGTETLIPKAKSQAEREHLQKIRDIDVEWLKAGGDPYRIERIAWHIVLADCRSARYILSDRFMQSCLNVEAPNISKSTCSCIADAMAKSWLSDATSRYWKTSVPQELFAAAYRTCSP